MNLGELGYEVTSRNGAPLNATRIPCIGEPRGVILIVPAMATAARHYTSLAKWFAEQGFTVHTFDYQGYGASARTPLKDVSADIFTWADDASAMLEHVATLEPNLPIHWVGHSLGGQLLPFADHTLLADATILCSGTGYWRLSEGRNRLIAPALWYAIAPLATRINGYYPGRKLKILGDLPAPVMRQWTRWCKHPNYMLGVHPELRQKFSAVRIPLTSISFTDDETMSAAATGQLESWFSEAQVESRRLSPEGLGVHRITHMGIINKHVASTWQHVFTNMT
ncbi:MAG: alpha/beta fold hydrolase [Microbacterium sp.]|jgi:predicted alpha/beta hydrolase|uniref:alpha/beta hydrolase family protein n=1 Tax=Microbacterium sp. TaxID=51671 RepID=UPI002821B766|nr:alpha/beta fold hydrolase [Microbacterium sp.]MDR2322042.1 alpha/beta fold hydrolase [Microbacterium sp.]